MIFESTEIDGALRLRLQPHEDARGFFARAWSASDFRPHGLIDELEQCALSYNRRAGTVRGMHYQLAPREETKIVRCVRGAIYDVLLDLRPASPTFTRWIGQELTADNRLALYVPPGVAHGFQTLADDTDVLYLISGLHDPALARGVRWDDPAFRITWPRPATVISERDRTYSDFTA